MPQNIPNPSQGLSNLLHHHSTQSPPYRHHNFIARPPYRHATVPPRGSYRYGNGTSTTNVRTQRPTRSYGHDDRTARTIAPPPPPPSYAKVRGWSWSLGLGLEVGAFNSRYCSSVQGAYIHHKEIKAVQGIKITAQNLEHAEAGTALYVVREDDDVKKVKESVMEDMRNVMSRMDKRGEGVYVQASTLGSLEALLEYLKTPAVNIPVTVSGVGIGPVHKKDVMKASVMLEKKKEFATILAFDVKVTPEAREHADDLGVKIFIADIIYHLFDQFKAYIHNLKEEKKRAAAEDAVFPCVLQIMPNCVFNTK